MYLSEELVSVQGSYLEGNCPGDDLRVNFISVKSTTTCFIKFVLVYLSTFSVYYFQSAIRFRGRSAPPVDTDPKFSPQVLRSPPPLPLRTG